MDFFLFIFSRHLGKTIFPFTLFPAKLISYVLQNLASLYNATTKLVQLAILHVDIYATNINKIHKIYLLVLHVFTSWPNGATGDVRPIQYTGAANIPLIQLFSHSGRSSFPR
jgi:hypothetical protein